jgi:hypothetical protein
MWGSASLTLVLAFAASCGAIGQSLSSAVTERTSFCEDASDDTARKPVHLPAAIVTAIMNTKEGKDALESSRAENTELVPERLLTGTTAKLSDSRELVFVVVGSSPLSGADNTGFWIVQQSGKNARILLFVGANCLNVSRSRTLGYRDIVSTWASAGVAVTQTFSYDGKSYKLRQRRSHQIR